MKDELRKNKIKKINKSITNSDSPPSLSDPLLNDLEAAEVLDTSPNTLPAWRHRGFGPDYVKVGRNVRYRLSALHDYINKQTVKLR